jgi:hypothetical protein
MLVGRQGVRRATDECADGLPRDPGGLGYWCASYSLDGRCPRGCARTRASRRTGARGSPRLTGQLCADAAESPSDVPTVLSNARSWQVMERRREGMEIRSGVPRSHSSAGDQRRPRRRLFAGGRGEASSPRTRAARQSKQTRGGSVAAVRRLAVAVRRNPGIGLALVPRVMAPASGQASPPRQRGRAPGPNRSGLAASSAILAWKEPPDVAISDGHHPRHTRSFTGLRQEGRCRSNTGRECSGSGFEQCGTAGSRARARTRTRGGRRSARQGASTAIGCGFSSPEAAR